MGKIEKPKIEKGKEEFGEPEKIEKGKPPKEEKKRLRWEVEKLERLKNKWEAEGKKTEEELEEELKKAREKIKETYPQDKGEKSEEKKKKEIFETIKEIIGIPEEVLIEWDDLILDDSEKAWRAREDEEKYNKEVIATVAGIDSEESRKYLTARLGKDEKQKNWKVISAALMFNDSDWADEIRDWLRYDKEAKKIRAETNAKIVKSLGLNKSEGWYNFRKVSDKAFPKGFYLPGDSLLSEIGVPAENKTKQDLLKEFGELHPAEAILSFLGDSSPEAQKNVEKYYRGDKKLKWTYKRYLKSIEQSPSEKNENG